MKKTDESWAELVNTLANTVHLVHARVGYVQGPQVPDPSAPEFQSDVLASLGWWEAIWRGQAARGIETAYVEPEHGPGPYLHHLPHTNVPVADLWTINSYIGKRVAEKFKDLITK